MVFFLQKVPITPGYRKGSRPALLIMRSAGGPNRPEKLPTMGKSLL
ncbi:MAG: hypothetical protein AVDCRST_MAG93-9287 [uncultured Chloroflexia bacterium]|uniref:Uncharacterized protein n=1 Tax=uncultured Chloroflexia bacterium TaxID=1672391 RepID=A0A6J4NAL0_9CHLR|nr:MAG: hypothetical protein AVDCRST_MAG93-9287 [uncultured Chloroflexia bacterium]